MNHSDDTMAIEISDSVLANIAQISALEVEGVVSLYTGLVDDFVDEVNKKLGRKSLSGVSVKRTEEAIIIQLYLVVQYGLHMPTISRQVQKLVREAITNMVDNKKIIIEVKIV